MKIKKQHLSMLDHAKSNLHLQPCNTLQDLQKHNLCKLSKVATYALFSCHSTRELSATSTN